jgi:16S rRNA (adenine1518-N6/adenine1519-N6)-dimethyltransferase
MSKSRAKLGQHFLHDRYIIDKIIAYIGYDAKINFVEIGPGKGALTIPFLEQHAQLSVIEIDQVLLPKLQRLQAEFPLLKVINEDALQVDFNKFCKSDFASMVVFSNLPYQISAPLMLKMRHYRSVLDKMVFMVQKEFADRIKARPGESAYGRISVMVQYWCDIEVVLEVPPESFTPMPKVMSSVFIATVHTKYNVKHPILFEKVVATAFRHKRKFCHSAFKKHIALDSWLGLGLAQTNRPGDLTVAEYIAITDYLYDIFGDESNNINFII